MKAYEHSASFSKLKTITERISKNLTTLEYLHTLDMFLWHALDPIHAECPGLFQNYVAKVVARLSSEGAVPTLGGAIGGVLSSARRAGR
jgi:DNA-binding IscR family transcriptional regulator